MYVCLYGMTGFDEAIRIEYYTSLWLDCLIINSNYCEKYEQLNMGGLSYMYMTINIIENVLDSNYRDNYRTFSSCLEAKNIWQIWYPNHMVYGTEKWNYFEYFANIALYTFGIMYRLTLYSFQAHSRPISTAHSTTLKFIALSSLFWVKTLVSIWIEGTTRALLKAIPLGNG